MLMLLELRTIQMTILPLLHKQTKFSVTSTEQPPQIYIALWTSSISLTLVEDFNLLDLLLMMVLETDLLLAQRVRLAHLLMMVARAVVARAVVVLAVVDLLNTMVLLLVLHSLEVISLMRLLVVTLMPSRVNLIP